MMITFCADIQCTNLINTNMKRYLTLSLFLICVSMISAQTKPFKVVKNANHFQYSVREFDSEAGTTDLFVGNNLIRVVEQTKDTTKAFIPGYSTEETYIDLSVDSVYNITIIDNHRQSAFLTTAPYKAMGIMFDTAKVNGLTRYTCSINSNKLEFYVQDYPVDINPIAYYGRFKGLLVSFWRNGQCYVHLTKAEKAKLNKMAIPTNTTRISPRKLSNLKRDCMVITTRIFDSVQLCWGKQNAHIDGDTYLNTPFDSVLHFAGGTLALKRIKLPKLPSHYQTFVEIHQRSNGDAYDRTGSLFVIPRMDDMQNFFRGMNEHPDSLPIFTDRQGQHYQGIRIEGDTQGSKSIYEPPLELVRFFTSFGVNHFNDRVKFDGLVWEDENYYKQEVTELSAWLQDEAWIGIWIGNYDGGGHIVTVDLKSYPNDYEWSIDKDAASYAKPLFNTCNVLEMAGQNYGKFFRTDSLTTTFTVPAAAKDLRLRYITTGHGGWGGGDEFVPKQNTILIDGKPIYNYTPWRCDCGRYREYNPVSGNFWNGISSSDLSRSGWCPGTATQPCFIPLPDLAPGQHTITVAIPQGQDEEGSFSHWCVSGALLFELAH